MPNDPTKVLKQCTAITNYGSLDEQCARFTTDASGLCWQHRSKKRERRTLADIDREIAELHEHRKALLEKMDDAGDKKTG